MRATRLAGQKLSFAETLGMFALPVAIVGSVLCGYNQYDQCRKYGFFARTALMPRLGLDTEFPVIAYQKATKQA